MEAEGLMFEIDVDSISHTPSSTNLTQVIATINTVTAIAAESAWFAKVCTRVERLNIGAWWVKVHRIFSTCNFRLQQPMFPMFYTKGSISKSTSALASATSGALKHSSDLYITELLFPIVLCASSFLQRLKTSYRLYFLSDYIIGVS